ncbi:MAG: tetratricopeptide repeat protein [Syntrophobacteraceae bacterium]
MTTHTRFFFPRYWTVLVLLGVIFLSWPILAGPAHAEEREATGRIVDMKGKVAVKSAADTAWTSAEAGRFLKAGDALLTGPDGWAAVLLADETLVQINRNTTFVMKEVTARAGWFKSREILPASASSSSSTYRVESGEAWFRNKNPNGSIKIETPSVTAALRGTELNIRIRPDGTSVVTVLEGRIGAYNDKGSLEAGAREEVVAAPGEPPRKSLLIEPENAVQWTLTIPDILLPRDVPVGSGDRPSTLQAILLRIENREPAQARELALQVVNEHPDDARAWSLLALIDLSRGDIEGAARESDRAVRQDPSSPAAWIVKSYVCQGTFDLKGATAAVEKSLALDEKNVVALVNLAKLQFGSGYPEKAAGTLEKALRLAPRSGDVHSLRGFLLLAARKTDAAMAAFREAVKWNPGLGEAHLGLALASMRQGNVPAALEEISAAIVLEPRRSLFLSYWAKMLYQLKRFDQALDMLDMASRLDPRDPTPALYKGIILRDLNRPTEAIETINRAMDLNDNRAVYRSRFLLDQDLAVKSVDLSILYSQLGLNAWSMNKALASIKYDYTNFAGHMFYAGGLFQEEAYGRVASNEALLGRLLMPANPNSFNTFNEYTDLFETPAIHGSISGTVGNFETYQGDAIIYGGSPQLNTAFTASVDHTETKGWRPTNYQRSTSAGGIIKWDPTPRDGIMFSASHLVNDRGDLLNGPYKYSYEGDPYNKGNSYSLRFELGYHHHFAPDSDLLLFYTHADMRTSLWEHSSYIYDPSFPIYLDVFNQSELKSPYHQAQAQQHFRFGNHQFIVGTLHFFGDKDADNTDVWIFSDNYGPFYGIGYYSKYGLPISFHSLYAEDIWHVTDTLTAEGAAYVDFMHQASSASGLEWDVVEFDPRLGLTWNPVKPHTFRLAAFRYTLPYFAVRLDPQEVAGVPIFRNNFEGAVTEEADFTWEYEWGSGLLSTNLFYLEKTLKYKIDEDTYNTHHGWARGFKTVLNQLLWKGTGLSAGYTFMNVSDEDTPATARWDHRLFASLQYLHSSGLSAWVTESLRYFDLKQSGLASQEIWLTDVGIGYQLPGKRGRLRLAVNNLFDRHFDWVVDPYIFDGRVPRRQILFTASMDF